METWSPSTVPFIHISYVRPSQTYADAFPPSRTKDSPIPEASVWPENTPTSAAGVRLGVGVEEGPGDAVVSGPAVVVVSREGGDLKTPATRTSAATASTSAGIPTVITKRRRPARGVDGGVVPALGPRVARAPPSWRPRSLTPCPTGSARVAAGEFPSWASSLSIC